MMDLVEVIKKARALLQSEGRMTYRTLKRQFALDDDALEDLIAEKNVSHLLKAVSHLVQLSKHRMWLDYDEAADVVYLHFVEHPSSTHSEMRDDGVILDYQGQDLVGVTVLEASQR